MATVSLQEFSPRIDPAYCLQRTGAGARVIRIASWRWDARVLVLMGEGESVKVGFIQTCNYSRVACKTLYKNHVVQHAGPLSDRIAGAHPPWYESSAEPTLAGVSPEVGSPGSRVIQAKMTDTPRLEVPRSIDGELVLEVVVLKRFSTWLAACISGREWVTLAATEQEIGCRLKIDPFDKKAPATSNFSPQRPSILISHTAPYPAIPQQAFVQTTISSLPYSAVLRHRKPKTQNERAGVPE